MSHVDYTILFSYWLSIIRSQVLESKSQNQFEMCDTSYCNNYKFKLQNPVKKIDQEIKKSLKELLYAHTFKIIRYTWQEIDSLNALWQNPNVVRKGGIKVNLSCRKLNVMILVS